MPHELVPNIIIFVPVDAPCSCDIDPRDVWMPCLEAIVAKLRK
jgi:hypothetical protein